MQGRCLNSLESIWVLSDETDEYYKLIVSHGVFTTMDMAGWERFRYLLYVWKVFTTWYSFIGPLYSLMHLGNALQTVDVWYALASLVALAKAYVWIYSLIGPWYTPFSFHQGGIHCSIYIPLYGLIYLYIYKLILLMYQLLAFPLWSVRTRAGGTVAWEIYRARVSDKKALTVLLRIHLTYADQS